MAISPLESGPDSLRHWMDCYQELAVRGLRSPAVEQNIRLHLGRFMDFFQPRCGHDRLSAWVRRDTLAWREASSDQVAAATVNNHLASLSGFTTWLQGHNPAPLSHGNPTGSIGELPLRRWSRAP